MNEANSKCHLKILIWFATVQMVPGNGRRSLRIPWMTMSPTIQSKRTFQPGDYRKKYGAVFPLIFHRLEFSGQFVECLEMTWFRWILMAALRFRWMNCCCEWLLEVSLASGEWEKVPGHSGWIERSATLNGSVPPIVISRAPKPRGLTGPASSLHLIVQSFRSRWRFVSQGRDRMWFLSSPSNI